MPNITINAKVAQNAKTENHQKCQMSSMPKMTNMAKITENDQNCSKYTNTNSQHKYTKQLNQVI